MQKIKRNANDLAIAYYRYSSHSQNEASIEQQREAAHAYAKSNGLTIVAEYEDAAKSGTNANRPGLQQMLCEVDKIRPAALILWKTDRLGRNRYDLAMAKMAIRAAGCSIRCVTENIPEGTPEGQLMEGMLESMAEFYSMQLSQNIKRGQKDNAENARSNGYNILGFRKNTDRRYEIDPDTAPIVRRIFRDYAEGKPLVQIADELNSDGLTTMRGGKFNVNGLRKTLQNRAYIGVYKYGDTVIEDGMPSIVDKETFDEVQCMFAKNKRRGAQRAHAATEEEAVDYWLTGKLYCGECKERMQGVSGRGRSGKKHCYYYCADQRRKKHQTRKGCKKKPVKKETIEDLVIEILEAILHDSGNLSSLAADAAEYYKRHHADTHYLDSLIASKKETDAALANILKAIEHGVFNETTQGRMLELERKSNSLASAIETERVKGELAENQHTIEAFFHRFQGAVLDDVELRENVLDYFIDKIYLYDDTLTITGWFSGSDREEIDIEDFEVEYRHKLGGNWFDRFVLGSTIEELGEHLRVFALFFSHSRPQGSTISKNILSIP